MNSLKRCLTVLALIALALTCTGVEARADDSGLRFVGTVQTIPSGGASGNWIVGGRTVIVSGATAIEGNPVLGSCVEVEGTARADASLDASKISVEDAGACGTGGDPAEPEFFGNLERLPASGLLGDWTVSGKTIHVSGSTLIKQEKGPSAIGACVEVKGPSNADGSISATVVEIRSGSGGCAMAPDRERLEVEFFGAVQSLPAGGQTGDWMIAGRLLRVSSATALDLAGRTIVVGSCVEAKGQFESDGSITATRIQFDDEACQAGARNTPAPRFQGVVQSLPGSGMTGTWQVGGRSIHIGDGTAIEQERGTIGPETCVAVYGTVQDDDSIVATRVESEGPDDCSHGAGSTGAFHVEGLITAVPSGGNIGDWQIAGRTVQVTSGTSIGTYYGVATVGACVEATGILRTDGVLVAGEIEVHSTSGICLTHGSVVSAASFTGVSAVPGQIISVFGLNNGPAGEHGPEMETEDRLRNRIANVRLLFDGQPAALLYVSPGQINAMVPYSVAGKSETLVQLENNGSWSNELKLPVGAAAPSIFTLTQSARGQGAILNYEIEGGRYTVNGSSNPAARGSIVLIYATGEGQTDPAGDDGRIVSSVSLPHPLLPVRVLVGDKEAEVLYSGGAPGFAAGLLQVNLKLADDTPVGPDVPVILIVGDARSRDGVTLAVR